MRSEETKKGRRLTLVVGDTVTVVNVYLLYHYGFVNEAALMMVRDSRRIGMLNIDQQHHVGRSLNELGEHERIRGFIPILSK